MEFSPNRHRTPLHAADLPDGPLTPRQRLMADAVRGCCGPVDFYSAPAETVTQITVCRIALGASDKAARSAVEAGLARAAAEIERMRAMLAAYGPAAFIPQSEPDDAPRDQFASRHEVLLAVLRQQAASGRVMTRAGDRRVEVDRNSAWVLA